jgi:hypothetical protein
MARPSAASLDALHLLSAGQEQALAAAVAGGAVRCAGLGSDEGYAGRPIGSSATSTRDRTPPAGGAAGIFRQQQE